MSELYDIPSVEELRAFSQSDDVQRELALQHAVDFFVDHILTTCHSKLVVADGLAQIKARRVPQKITRAILFLFDPIDEKSQMYIRVHRKTKEGDFSSAIVAESGHWYFVTADLIRGKYSTRYTTATAAMDKLTAVFTSKQYRLYISNIEGPSARGHKAAIVVEWDSAENH